MDNEIKTKIIKTIAYFDIFRFPLRSDEIRRFCTLPVTAELLSEVLASMEAEASIWQQDGYYTLLPRPDWVRERNEKYVYSCRKMEVAGRSAAIIAAFPFVEGVAISGSLSKYAADENADIDFFIIAKANRLWICRSFLHAFKKLTYFFGKQHDFCMNYFLDENELELKDKNIFTATELTTILPVYGPKAFLRFVSANQWINRVLPNSSEFPLIFPQPAKKHLIKSVLELGFAGKWGTFINRQLMLLTVRWWRQKFRRQGFPMQYFDLDLRSTLGESKYHPDDYQRRILNAHKERVEAFESVL